MKPFYSNAITIILSVLCLLMIIAIRAIKGPFNSFGAGGALFICLAGVCLALIAIGSISAIKEYKRKR